MSRTGNRRYLRNRAKMLAENNVCGICGHSGALTADHIIPAKLWPRDECGKLLPGLDELTNLRPAHGSMGAGRARLINRCVTCGRLCNQSRGAGPAVRVRTRKWL